MSKNEDGVETAYTNAVVVAEVAPFAGGDPNSQHVTLFYFGEAADRGPELLAQIQDEVEVSADEFPPFEAKVSGVAYLGPDKARVLLLESWDLAQLRQQMWDGPAIQRGLVESAGDQYPFFIPHTTLSYDGELPQVWPETVSITGLGLWKAGEKLSYPLTGTDSSDDDEALVLQASGSVPLIHTERDLAMGIRVADVMPDARWYVIRRARAFGQAERIPSHWNGVDAAC